MTIFGELTGRRRGPPFDAGMEAILTHAARLRAALDARDLIPFIGTYDVLSASIAAKHHDALFISGSGCAASHYGLPDVGFIAWPDIVDARRAASVSCVSKLSLARKAG